MKNKKIGWLVFLFFCSCSKDTASEVEVKFTEAGSQASYYNVKQFNDGMYSNKKLQAQYGLSNYLDPLTLSIEGRVVDFEYTSYFNPGFEVHFYTSNIENPDGSFLRFEYDKERQGFSIYFYSRSDSEQELCFLADSLSEQGDFNIKLQVENSIGNVKFAIWNMYKSPTNQRYIQKDILNFKTSECSSKTTNNIVVNLLGVSNQWGFILNSVDLLSVKRGAYYEL